MLIGSKQSAKQMKNIEYLQYINKDFLAEFLQDLLKRNISSILVEGGQKTLNTFISKNLFDELVLYTAPIILGKESKDTMKLSAPATLIKSKKLKLVKIESFKEDIKATYYNQDT